MKAKDWQEFQEQSLRQMKKYADSVNADAPKEASMDLKDLLRQGAAGDAHAQACLGTLYYRGQGVSKDYTEAAKWYRMAADQGNPQAQYNLGTMYYNGFGVPLDHDEGARLREKAAQQGIADSGYTEELAPWELRLLAALGFLIFLVVGAATGFGSVYGLGAAAIELFLIVWCFQPSKASKNDSSQTETPVNTDARKETSAAPQIVFRSVYWLCIVLVGAIGMTIGKISGILIAAPALPALAFFLLGKRFLGENKKPYLSLLSVLFGHSTWMLLSAVLLTGTGVNALVNLEAVFYFAAVLWLAIKPGRVPLIVLSIYTTIALVQGLAASNTPGPFMVGNTPGPLMAGLVLNIYLRIIILLMMAPLLFKMLVKRQSSESMEEQPTFTAADEAQQDQDLSPQGKEKDLPNLAVTGEEAQQDFDLTALTKEKQELLKKKAYLDLQAEVERLREEVATKVKK